jgi:hypothetical protein
MGALEDAIAAGDTAKQAELSSFFREAQANHITPSDYVRDETGHYYIADPAKREARARMVAAAEVEAATKRKTLADLVALAQGVKGLDPEGQAAVLGRYGINFKPRDKDAEILKRQVLLQTMRDASRQGRASGALPADLVGSIGTKDFRQRLQDAAGTLDRRSVDTLMDLDRKEREFQAKGIAKPGKLSPFAQRLREMEALGVPITEDVVRGVYTPASVVPSPTDPTRRGRPVSLSALAGLTGGAGAEEDEPIGENPVVSEIDDRRRRLRSTLFGGGSADY